MVLSEKPNGTQTNYEINVLTSNILIMHGFNTYGFETIFKGQKD
ncbi:MAG: hypothetical protein ACI8ZX_001369 [Planctomycetota bacterium]|jgi:hypothetical protein